MRYFSERELGEGARETDEIGGNVLRGILAVIERRVRDGSFGANFPDTCPDNSTLVRATDQVMLDNALRAEIPELAAHVEEEFGERKLIFDALGVMDPPPIPCILDLIEFCWKNVGVPIPIGIHPFSGDTHFTSDVEDVRDSFREDIEQILRRNGIAYGLTEGGQVERLVPQVFRSAVLDTDFRTCDIELDRLLKTAQEKFLDTNPATRRESLESLWDAWERLKTIGGVDKKQQSQLMLDKSAGKGSPKFRDALEREARELTSIGNQLRIRHSETQQEILSDQDHVDYLFYRMFSLVRMIIRLTL